MTTPAPAISEEATKAARIDPPFGDQRFDTFDQWVSRASSWLICHQDYNDTEHGGKGWRGHHFTALCFDSFGRRCRIGADMQRARDEDAFPVWWIWPDQILPALLQARQEGMREGTSIKPLEWEDADEGMCTKWRAAALGGNYELVAFEGESGFAVNFHWGRPLSFWFIQGEPDEWGPTGPKMFASLEEAKAAAQSDYEARARSAILSNIEEA